jgi:hypothetical protein
MYSLDSQYMRYRLRAQSMRTTQIRTTTIAFLNKIGCTPHGSHASQTFTHAHPHVSTCALATIISHLIARPMPESTCLLADIGSFNFVKVN